MLDRLGNDVDFTELFMEETLSSKDKKELPDSMYGLVYTDEKGNKIRKFPLNDESHVRQAAIFFDRAKGLSDDQKRELARNIVRRAKELDMDYSGWESLKPYLDKSVKESFMTYEWLMKQNYPDPDSTSGTSDFDDNDHEPDDCFTESFEEMFGPVIQEAFDAVTGKEIPIDKAYSLEEMKERTYTEEELKKSKREIKDYLKFANDIVKRISKQVEKDAKEPTGNQNCLLCTWCAEIGFRGVNKNPRPVYSPCDPIFKVHGENIVHDPMKIIPRGYDNLLEHLADVSQPFARFYVHVNWKGSRGGHEFLLLKVIDDECYIVDAQGGKVDKLSDTHKYFTDINWENSYLCRLDNKNFNRKLFDTMNDPKMILPWDPKRDIPYMLREGLITKDEAETELKRAETNEFYKVLKEKLGQTPIQESADSLSLFEKLPKDLQEFLEKRDFSIVNEDYGIDGYGVEEFFKPEFIDIAGKSYDLKKDDKFYNAIVFATDGGGNDFVFLPSDGYYYILDHEVYNELDHIHGDKLSSRKWSTLIDPNHTREFEENERKEISIKYRNLTSDPMYLIITKYALMDNITMKDCNTFKMSYDYTMRKTDWLTNIDNFALEYKCMYLKDVVLEFMEFMIKGFVKWLKYDNDGLKKVCIKIVEAFIKAKNELGVDTSQLLANVTQRHKEFINKYGQKSIQESALPDGVFLRPATLKDVPTMRDWQLESINARLRKRPDMFEYMEKDARESVPDTKMIMSGDQTIGMLQCCWIDDGEWWYIGEIYLIAEFRGRGIGSTLLLNEISEHDKLRLQVATDNPRAKALYESLGFKTVRTNQDMEVMDLVKTPESVCENMVEQLKSFKYGLGSNGSVHFSSSKEYDEKYRLESPEEFEENGGGICYDYVEFMDKYLKEYGYHCRKFFISTDTENMDTHTFILVNDGKGGYVYPESAFKLLEGVHHVKSPEEAALKVMDKIFDINDNGKKYDEIKYYVWEYEGHPPYGSDMETCHKYFSKGEPFHEGTAKKLK